MIGVFDSGFGGLTILKELLKILPQYDYIYLGDQAHVPYGPRSKTTIQKFTEQNVLFLLEKGANIIVIACNSATTAALSYLQKKYPDKHILGVVVPAAEKAVSTTRFGNIGAVGTTATVNSSVYKTEIMKAAESLYKPSDSKARASIHVYEKACPLLVPLIEEGWHKKPETRSIMKKYLRSLKDNHIDTLILGCTHYPILEKEFKQIMGKNCIVINSPKEQALALKTYLNKHPEVEKSLEKNSQQIFYTTDSPEKFMTLGSLFLGQKIKNGEKVEIC